MRASTRNAKTGRRKLQSPLRLICCRRGMTCALVVHKQMMQCDLEVAHRGLAYELIADSMEPGEALPYSLLPPSMPPPASSGSGVVSLVRSGGTSGGVRGALRCTGALQGR